MNAWPSSIPPARPRSLLENLLDVPSRFSFDAAIAVMMRASGQGEVGAAVRFQAPVGLAFASADILAVRSSPGGFTATPGMVGLTGPAGVLPRPYTEIANAEHRQRSAALADFLDVLAQRPVAQFAEAGKLDQVICYIAPVTLGAGRPLFPRRFDFRLVEVHQNKAFIAARYDVVGPRA